MANFRIKAEFERIMLPHMASAYNLAVFLLLHPHDAQDAVQESYIKAFRAFAQFKGVNSSAWLLKIVRNTCISQLRGKSRAKVVFLHSDALELVIEARQMVLEHENATPEAEVISHAESVKLRRAISKLSIEYREVILLREFEELSYKQISSITDVPIGTVMSRLSRARISLRNYLISVEIRENGNEL